MQHRSHLGAYYRTGLWVVVAQGIDPKDADTPVAPSFLEVISPTQTDVGFQWNPNDAFERESIVWEGKSFSRLTSVAAGEQEISPD